MAQKVSECASVQHTLHAGAARGIAYYQAYRPRVHVGFVDDHGDMVGAHVGQAVDIFFESDSEDDDDDVLMFM